MARKKSARRRASSRGTFHVKAKPSRKYDDPFYKIVPSAIFGLAGLFYLLAPYEFIVANGLGFNETATGHDIFGIVFLVISGVFWVVNSKRKQ